MSWKRRRTRICSGQVRTVMSAWRPMGRRRRIEPDERVRGKCEGLRHWLGDGNVKSGADLPCRSLVAISIVVPVSDCGRWRKRSAGSEARCCGRGVRYGTWMDVRWYVQVIIDEQPLTSSCTCTLPYLPLVTIVQCQWVDPIVSRGEMGKGKKARWKRREGKQRSEGAVIEVLFHS